MSGRLRHPSVVLCSLLCALACAWNACGAEPAPATGTPESPPAQARIDAALDRPVRLDLARTPLADAVRLLEKKLGIPFRLDAKGLDEAGIDPNRRTVTLQIDGISARSALRLVLRELDLTWIVRGEVLLITTPEEAECCLQTRLYPVGDLLGCGEPRRPGQSDFEDLVNVVVGSIQPASWAEVGGPGSIMPFGGFGVNCLVASQTEETHAAIGWLLAELRKVERKRAGRPVKPDRPTPEDAMRKALRRPVKMDFVETPLQDVVDFLKDLLEIEIQLDIKVLDDVGVGTDTPVTISVKGISARSALNLVLRPLDLTWVIQDEVLLITTPEQAESLLLQTKVYDVTDLVLVAEPKKEATDVPAAGAPAADDRIPAFLRPSGVFEPSGPGGAVSIFRGPHSSAVILTASREVREEFEDLLGQLRKVSGETTRRQQ